MFFPDVKIQWKRQKSSISKNAVKLKPLKIKSWNLQVKSSRYRCLRISQFYSHNWLNNLHLSKIKITWKLICTDTTEVVSVQIFSWLYLNLEFFFHKNPFVCDLVQEVLVILCLKISYTYTVYWHLEAPVRTLRIFQMLRFNRLF